MKTKELKIQVPDGYEIDKEKSTFENIVFRKKEEKRWRDDRNKRISGYCINNSDSRIMHYTEFSNISVNYNLFTTEKQAKSALAMARISQIMANDERFGGPVTDNEWRDATSCKYIIKRECILLQISTSAVLYHFLAFHTKEQRDLFLKENEDLVKDYLMID